MFGTQETAVDVIGVGFGPSNLALAVAIEELSDQPAGPYLRSLFLESQPEFNWHPGMLMRSTRLQVSFLKDVVTMRNPRSRFTFLNYLAEHGRIAQFINLRENYPTRVEYNDYFRWVAGQFSDVVKYGRRVVSVEPVEEPAGVEDGVNLIKAVVVDAEGGRRQEYFCRNLVVATGGVPHLPDAAQGFTHDRVFHSSKFLERMAGEFPDREAPHRFVVVGAGQSAAEILDHLAENYPRASVLGIVRGFGFRPMDESHFVNELFSPQAVDGFYQMPASLRSSLLAEHRYTNYAAVDLDLIRGLYKRLYQDQLSGRRQFKVLRMHELSRLEGAGEQVIVHLYDSIAKRTLCPVADGVIFATGYRFPNPPPLLAPLAPYLLQEPSGRLQVGRDYRVATRMGFSPKVFLQGFCEESHGISDTLLSVLATRSWRIAQAIAGAPDPAPQSPLHMNGGKFSLSCDAKPDVCERESAGTNSECCLVEMMKGPG
jgi:L-ornithine N5-monooxygenase